jgi:ADP-heptose:LPS heptosyltransferase
MIFTKLVKKYKVLDRLIIRIFSFVIILIRYLVKKEEKRSGKIVIIAMQRLGDAVFSLDAINSIAYFHKQNIVIICNSNSSDIFRYVFPNIELIELTTDDFYFNKRLAKSQTIAIVKNIHPERIYDLCGSISTASMLLFLPVKIIIGINLEYYKSIYSSFTSIRKEPHITEIYTDAIKNIMPVIRYEPINKSMSKDYFLIHPFAGWAAKEWGINRFIKLASVLNRYKKSFLVLQDNQLSNGILEEINKNNIELLITNSTKELIAAISDCSLFIGNDSGPVQIANLLGKPTFTIYGPTNPDYHKPLKGENRFIIKELTCSSQNGEKWCSHYGGMIGCNSFECMLQLEYGDVEKAIMNYIKSLGLLEKKLG